ncbi:hypothetical protein JJD41_01570 [Oxynema sp. CENA135]|uniref:hypothetical protein n=1 Tax=Oxynema sp. CENA135 TaxID=984206 RepID=UPI001909E8D9|nr:hypothetical protein [Oxynema sp. CENA135]MBK4728578.1 hypothetical protein [Oxynema sp. CENA135]
MEKKIIATAIAESPAIAVHPREDSFPSRETIYNLQYSLPFPPPVIVPCLPRLLAGSPQC